MVESIPPGKVGMNKKIRECLQVSLVDKLNVELYDNPSDGFMTDLDMEVELGLNIEGMDVTELDDQMLAECFKKEHRQKYLK